MDIKTDEAGRNRVYGKEDKINKVVSKQIVKRSEPPRISM